MSLPGGYKILEYIESNGTQYVDTDFKPNQNTRLVVDFQSTTTTASLPLFGTRDAAKINAFALLSGSTSQYQFDYGTSQKASLGAVDTSRHTFNLNKNVFVLDGTTKHTATSETFSCSYPLFLFTVNNGGAAHANGCRLAKLYSCQIYDNGTLVRDFIPCQTSSDEVGLWDDVNATFYGNAGDGVFTAGPVLEEIPPDEPPVEPPVEPPIEPANGTPITNLVPTTGWAYSDVSYADGVFTFSPGVTAMSQVPMPTPTPGHKYYGRAMQKAPVGFTFADHRFEWYAGDTPTGLMCFARLVDTGDQWVMSSDILTQETPDEGAWVIRNFIVNGSATAYRKELLIVDLTETFGAGNEPDKAWCDANIPYFSRMTYLAEQPEGFSVVDATMQAAVLTWKTASIEETYRLYRNDALIYEGSGTHYTDSGLVPGLSYSYRLTGYNGVHETVGMTLDVRTRDTLQLITDRTAADVYSGNRKGRYNAADLIRVGEAMLYAQSLLAQSGFSVSIDPKLDWTLDDIPTHAQMERYLADIRTLRFTMDLISSTPQVPESMSGLTWKQANDIETIIKNIEHTVDHVFAGLFRAGQFDAMAGDRRPFPTANSDMGRTWEGLDSMETTWANWELATWYLLLYGNLKEEGVVS